MRINDLYNVNRWTLVDQNNQKIGAVIKKTEPSKEIIDSPKIESNINIEEEVKVKTLKKESFRI